MVDLITVSCIVEWACYLTLVLSIYAASRQRPIPGIAWLCSYAACSGWGRLLTAASVWQPGRWRPVQALWHVVTAAVGIGATYQLVRLTRRHNAVRHLSNALQDAALAIDAQQLVDAIPFPAAVMGSDGDITAVNEALRNLLGCTLRDVEGFRWTRYFRGRERVRLLANWVDFGAGAIENFYEESTWRRPADGQLMQIATRGLLVGAQLVCSVADVTLIPPRPGGP